MVNLTENIYDLSLSDVIKQKKKLKKATQIKQEKGAGQGKRKQTINNNRKGRGVGGVNQRKANQGNKNTQWRRRGRGGQGGPGALRQSATATLKSNRQQTKPLSGKMIVKNLHFNVSDNDVKELFSSLGKLRSSRVHYSSAGKSLGVADVHFDRRIDAEKACKTYNGVPLDGRPMRIELVDKSLPVANRVGPIKKQAPKGNQAGNNARRGQTGGNRGGRQSGGQKRGQKSNNKQQKPKKVKKEEVTVEELDKQLDSYLAEK